MSEVVGTVSGVVVGVAVMLRVVAGLRRHYIGTVSRSVSGVVADCMDDIVYLFYRTVLYRTVFFCTIAGVFCQRPLVVRMEEV